MAAGKEWIGREGVERKGSGAEVSKLLELDNPIAVTEVSRP